MIEQLNDLYATLPATRTDAAALDTNALRTILDNVPLAVTRLLLIYAAVWAELESRDEDLSEYIANDNLIYRWVRRIARGAVAAAAVAKFGTATRVMRLVSKLPILVQEKLAADPKVPLLDPQNPEDIRNHVPKDIGAMEKWELAQVFDQGAKEIRGLESQAMYIRQFSAPTSTIAKRGRELVRGRLAMNRQTNRIRVLGPDADLENAVELLKALGYTVTPPAE